MRLRGLLITFLAIMAQPAYGTEAIQDALATLSKPIDIVGEGDLSFGTLAVPRTATCSYEVTATGDAQVEGGEQCRFLAGEPLAAEFSVSCAQDELVTYEVIYADQAPAGTTFLAPKDPMMIDGYEPGPALQTRPCDSDGLSDIIAGGRLVVTPNAPDSFSGTVGTIRLEATYE